jgi:hypothetical protein
LNAAAAAARCSFLLFNPLVNCSCVELLLIGAIALAGIMFQQHTELQFFIPIESSNKLPTLFVVGRIRQYRCSMKETKLIFFDLEHWLSKALSSMNMSFPMNVKEDSLVTLLSQSQLCQPIFWGFAPCIECHPTRGPLVLYCLLTTGEDSEGEMSQLKSQL